MGSGRRIGMARPRRSAACRAGPSRSLATNTIANRTGTALGWTAIDPVSARLVGAALAGIGIQSLLGRNESADAFRSMLGLKCIWSAVAIVGLGLSLVQGAPRVTWALLAIFVAFAALWNYYRLHMRAAGG